MFIGLTKEQIAIVAAVFIVSLVLAVIVAYIFRQYNKRAMK